MNTLNSLSKKSSAKQRCRRRSSATPSKQLKRDPAASKVGWEVVRSVNLPSNIYKKFNAASFAIFDDRWTRVLRRALQ